ncbi:uncharacterized protein [Cherax quadricarinatus]|uniref:uncharacterized protein isoform X2 n=1 Tax=Cherax quadricarinatus TaxID=27406 RepID=UPI00387E680E
MVVSHHDCLIIKQKVVVTAVMASMEEEELDPRVQEANNLFRATLTESTAVLKSLAKKLGSCIEKARPYYEAQELARTSQLDCQRAAVQYQRANALHQAAKETIALAEERFVNCRHEQWQFDSAWQEMLNHATIKVMEAEAQKAASEREHMRRASVFQQAEQRVQQLQRGLRSSINKSLIYFEEKAKVQAQLESQKERVQQLQRAVAASKLSYAQSLRSLEQISEEIHEQRRCHLPREPGVGAELTPPEAVDALVNDQGAKPFSPLEEMTSKEEEYWECLREKLEKLQVCNPQLVTANNEVASDCEYPDGQECTVTNSNCTFRSCLEKVVGMERVVSGESHHGSESEEVHGPVKRKELSLEDVFVHVTFYASDMHERNKTLVKEELQCLPNNCYDNSTKSWDNINKEPSLSRRLPVGSHTFKISDNLHMVYDNGQSATVGERTTVSSGISKEFNHSSLTKKVVGKMYDEDKSAALESTVSDIKMEINECKFDRGNNDAHNEEYTDDVIISETIEGIKKSNEYEEKIYVNESNGKLGEKEEGDGSSSPPPAMCQPCRVLSVIPEGVESYS